MTQQGRDLRRLSGKRVFAQCELFKPAFTNSLPEKDNTIYPIVFNLRGGCIYIQHYLDTQHLHALFPKNNEGTISQLTLCDTQSTLIELHDIPLRFVRLRTVGDSLGIVFRFVNLSAEHMDFLHKAYSAFPTLAVSESCLQFDDENIPTLIAA